MCNIEDTKKPTFLAGSVYFNDSVSLINNEYVITSSYYTAERNALQPYLDENDEVLLNKKVSEDFVIKNGDYLFLDQSKMATYHDKLVKKFGNISVLKNINIEIEENEKIVGVIMAGNDGRRGYIYHTAVLPEFRGKHIAKTLVENAMAALEKEGITKVALVVFEKNKN